MKEMNYYSLYLEKILLGNDLAMGYGNPFIEAAPLSKPRNLRCLSYSENVVWRAHNSMQNTCHGKNLANFMQITNKKGGSSPLPG